MSTFPKEIELTCIKYGEPATYILQKIRGNKAEYLCTRCLELAIIDKEIITDRSKREMWNTLADVYQYIREAGGKLLFILPIVHQNIKDEKLTQEIEKALDYLMLIRDEIKKKLGAL